MGIISIICMKDILHFYVRFTNFSYTQESGSANSWMCTDNWGIVVTFKIKNVTVEMWPVVIYLYLFIRSPLHKEFETRICFKMIKVTKKIKIKNRPTGPRKRKIRIHQRESSAWTLNLVSWIVISCLRHKSLLLIHISDLFHLKH